jgi:hypothetical protein
VALAPAEEADEEAPDRRHHLPHIWPGDRAILVLAPDLFRMRAAAWASFGGIAGRAKTGWAGFRRRSR